MTPSPEEKAKELIDKYRGTLKYGQRQWGQVHYATQCAIICVQEIIAEYIKRFSIGEIDFNTSPNPIEKWQSVLEHLQKQ